MFILENSKTRIKMLLSGSVGAVNMQASVLPFQRRVSKHSWLCVMVIDCVYALEIFEIREPQKTIFNRKVFNRSSNGHPPAPPSDQLYVMSKYCFIILAVLIELHLQALQIHLQPDEGDILIFMPGQEDIEVTCEVREKHITF